MFRLALRTLRFRKGGFVATFIAIFFGAAIVMACGGLMETGIRTAVAPQRLAGTAVVVAGDQHYDLTKENPDDPEEDSETAVLAERVRLDAGLVDKVRAVPGVATAVGDVSFPVTVLRDRHPVTESDRSLGHGWSSAELMPYTLSGGAAPGPGEIVLDPTLAREAGTRVGGQIEVAAHGTVATYRVAGIATPADGVTTNKAAMFFSDADLPPLLGQPNLVDSIGVLASPGTDVGELRQRISDALRGQPVVTLTGDDRGAAEFPEVERSSETMIIISAVFGGLAIMVAMFVVASTLGLSVQQREREIALLRAIAATPGQLRRMVRGEGMVVAALATALSIAPGLLLGRWLFDQLAANEVVAPMVEFHQGLLPIAVAVGASLLTTLIAASVASRRAARTRPTEALAEASVERDWLTKPRVFWAVLCFAGGIALAMITMLVMTGPIAASTAGPAVMVWAIAMALISPGVTRAMTALLARPVRAMSGVAGYLATLNAKARTIRMAAAVTPIMLATGIATANIYLQTTQSAAAEEAYSENLRADVVLSSSTGGLAPDVLEAVRTVPGVDGASAFVASSAFVEKPYDSSQGDEGYQVQGVTADSVAKTTAVAVTAGRLDELTGNTVALPTGNASGMGRGVGDTISMRLGDRSLVDLRVVALYDARPGYETILMPADLVAAHTTTGLPTQILVRAAPGTDVGQLTTALTERTRHWPGVAVADRKGGGPEGQGGGKDTVLTATFAAGLKTGEWVNFLMAGMIIAYTAISVVNTLVMATGRRRREFGLQRLTGSTTRQVMKMLTVEALLVAVIGVVLGTLVSTATLVPFSVVVSDSPIPSGPLWIYLAVVGVAGVLALASTLLPAWRAIRSSPAEAVAIGE